ncbi:hypothetical protein HZH68_016934 [Vespula germanica]|uniref:Uncharacterized protein n=1 Tax=Vespula germanica TaxID=30212 RepID=A0A834J0H7_VESGE|nr:hypothetical protein HZH68_016934 [Vespula germanica]
MYTERITRRWTTTTKSLDAILDAMAAPQSAPPVERTVRRERRTFYLQGIMETPREKYSGGQITFRLDLWVEISSETVNMVKRCVCLARNQGSSANSKITTVSSALNGPSASEGRRPSSCKNRPKVEINRPVTTRFEEAPTRAVMNSKCNKTKQHWPIERKHTESKTMQGKHNTKGKTAKANRSSVTTPANKKVVLLHRGITSELAREETHRRIHERCECSRKDTVQYHILDCPVFEPQRPKRIALVEIIGGKIWPEAARFNLVFSAKPELPEFLMMEMGCNLLRSTHFQRRWKWLCASPWFPVKTIGVNGAIRRCGDVETAHPISLLGVLSFSEFQILPNIPYLWEVDDFVGTGLEKLTGKDKIQSNDSASQNVVMELMKSAVNKGHIIL